MSDIIQLSVGIESAATPRTSFGIPLILDHQNTAGLTSQGGAVSVAGNAAIRAYGSLAEMRADGWKVYHAAYKLAASMLAQQPRVSTFKVAGMATGVEADDLDDIVTEDADWYALLYTSRTASKIKALAAWVESAPSRCIYIGETSDAAAKAAGVSVLSELHALGRLRTAVVYRDSTKQTVELVFDKSLVAANSFNCKINGVALAGAVVYAASHNATMDAIAVAIALVAGVGSASAIVSTGALGAAEKDTIVVEATSSVIDLLFTEIVVSAGLSQPSVLATETIASNVPADAAWVGKLLPQTPGSATWAHKTLKSVLPDSLTTAARTAIEAQNGNWYSNELGFDIAYPGSMVGDSAPGTPMWIDLIEGVDAFESDLQTAIMDLLNKSPKIPYTDAGVGLILSAATQVESKYVSSGFLVQKAFEETYTIPLVEDAAPADKSSRILRGLQASYQTAGGIHVIADFTVKLAA